MKKFGKIIAVVVALLITCIVPMACSNDGGSSEPAVDKTRTITFDSRGGTSVEPVKTTNTGYVNELPDGVCWKRDGVFAAPTREGYEFWGWFADISEFKTFKTGRIIDQDITLYAKWKKILTDEECTFEEDSESDSGSYVLTGYRSDEEAIILPTEHNHQPVTKIKANALAECAATYVTIPYGYEKIGDAAFQNCGNLKIVDILAKKNDGEADRNSLIEIGASAFARCQLLDAFEIPDTVTTIGASAFNGCVNMQNLLIPLSVENIGVDAFDNCDRFTAIYCKSSAKPSGWVSHWCGANRSDIVKYNCMGSYGVIYQNDFDHVIGYVGTGMDGYIQVNAKYIGDSAFYQCSWLESISLSNVSYIGSKAFAQSNLKYVFIPKSVMKIYDYAFMDCDKLTTIHCEAEAKPYGWSSLWNYNCDAQVSWKTSF